MTGSLEARLRDLYRGLDTSAGFDESVMARVRAESDAAKAERLARARAEEAQRYQLARRRQSWGAWFGRVVTPDAVGAAAFAGFVLNGLWRGIQTQAGPLVSAYAPLSLTVLGIALALSAPVLLLQRHRHMSRAT